MIFLRLSVQSYASSLNQENKTADCLLQDRFHQSVFDEISSIGLGQQHIRKRKTERVARNLYKLLKGIK